MSIWSPLSNEETDEPQEIINLAKDDDEDVIVIPDEESIKKDGVQSQDSNFDRIWIPSSKTINTDGFSEDERRTITTPRTFDLSKPEQDLEKPETQKDCSYLEVIDLESDENNEKDNDASSLSGSDTTKSLNPTDINYVLHNIYKQRFCAPEPIPHDNKGYSLLKKIGYIDGCGLGKTNTGIVEPLSHIEIPSNFLVNFSQKMTNKEIESEDVLDEETEKERKKLVENIEKFLDKFPWYEGTPVEVTEVEKDITNESYMVRFDDVADSIFKILNNQMGIDNIFIKEINKIEGFLMSNFYIHLNRSEFFFFRNKCLLLNNLLDKLIPLINFISND